MTISTAYLEAYGEKLSYNNVLQLTAHLVFPKFGTINYSRMILAISTSM